MRAKTLAIIGPLGLWACSAQRAPSTAPAPAPPVATTACSGPGCAAVGPVNRHQYFDKRRRRFYYFDPARKMYYWEDGSVRS